MTENETSVENVENAEVTAEAQVETEATNETQPVADVKGQLNKTMQELLDNYEGIEKSLEAEIAEADKAATEAKELAKAKREELKEAKKQKVQAQKFLGITPERTTRQRSTQRAEGVSLDNLLLETVMKHGAGDEATGATHAMLKEAAAAHDYAESSVRVRTNGLANDKLILVRRDEEDGRKALYFISAKGRKALEKAQAEAEANADEAQAEAA